MTQEEAIKIIDSMLVSLDENENPNPETKLMVEALAFAKKSINDYYQLIQLEKHVLEKLGGHLH